VNLIKVFDRVPREVIIYPMRKLGVDEWPVSAIRVVGAQQLLEQSVVTVIILR